MAADLCEIDDILAVEHAEIHDLVRRFIQVFHERNRDFVQVEALQLHALAELEEPNPKRELFAGPLQPTALDETVGNPMHGRFRQLRPSRKFR